MFWSNRFHRAHQGKPEASSIGGIIRPPKPQESHNKASSSLSIGPKQGICGDNGLWPLSIWVDARFENSGWRFVISHLHLPILESLMLYKGLIINAVRTAPNKRIALSPHKVAM